MITKTSSPARAYDLKRHSTKLKHEYFVCFSLFLFTLFLAYSFFFLSVYLLSIALLLVYLCLCFCFCSCLYFCLFLIGSLCAHTFSVYLLSVRTLKIKWQTNTYCECTRKRLKVNMRFEHFIDSFLMLSRFVYLCQWERMVRCSANNRIPKSKKKRSEIVSVCERMFDA